LIEVRIKIYSYDVFGEGSITFFVNENSTVMDVLNKIGIKYGDIYERKFCRKLLNDFGTYFGIFLNNEFVYSPSFMKQKVENGDNILILHPISGGK